VIGGSNAQIDKGTTLKATGSLMQIVELSASSTRAVLGHQGAEMELRRACSCILASNVSKALRLKVMQVGGQEP
jgi:hypothetical protein